MFPYFKRRIRVTTNFPWFPLFRQLPESRCWGDVRFVFDDDSDADAGEFDGWVVFNNFPGPGLRTLHCNPNRTLLVVGEPPSRTHLIPSFARQFGAVVSCLKPVSGTTHIRSQQSLPWWVGLRRVDQFKFETALRFEDFEAQTAISKSKKLSIICSTLAITPGHRRRLEFVRKIQRHFGSRIEIFGDGARPVEDKWDALAPFEYSIILENSSISDYWTEKLSDAYLAGTFPFYWGCQNLRSYFPEEASIGIDIRRPEAAIEVIEKAMASDIALSAQSALKDARQRVLKEYNIFPSVLKWMERVPEKPGANVAQLRHASEFSATLGMRVTKCAQALRELAGRGLHSVRAIAHSRVRDIP